VEHDNAIQFLVSDEGRGISLDESLKRLHKELANRIETDGVDKIKNSEWMKNIKRALGKKQASLLLAWPNDPFAIRGLTVGSILDLQFVAGFSGQSWELRSVTSGTGLWGVRYLTEKLGGVVMGTNSFDGGAVFSITLPKERIVVSEKQSA
jgi:hypothetical protein